MKDDRGKRISDGLKDWHAKRTAQDKARTRGRLVHTLKRKNGKLRGRFSGYLPIEGDPVEEL